MKKVARFTSLLLAVLVIGFSSCKKDNKEEPFTPVPSPITKTYNGTVKIYLKANPTPEDQPDQTITGQNISLVMYPAINEMSLKIKDLEIDIPPITAKTDVAISEIPYTPLSGAYKVAFSGKKTISFMGTTADVKSINGTITDTKMPLVVYAEGSEELANMPVTISIDATVLPQ